MRVWFIHLLRIQRKMILYSDANESFSFGDHLNLMFNVNCCENKDKANNKMSLNAFSRELSTVKCVTVLFDFYSLSLSASVRILSHVRLYTTWRQWCMCVFVLTFHCVCLPRNFLFLWFIRCSVFVLFALPICISVAPDTQLCLSAMNVEYIWWEIKSHQTMLLTMSGQ